MVIALAYCIVLAVWALSIALRHGPILLRGRTVEWLTGIGLGLQVVVRPDPPLLWISLFAILFAGSWSSRDTWFVFKQDPSGLASAIETRMARVLVEFVRDQGSHQLSFAGHAASLRIRRFWGGLVTLTFGGSWQENKAKVLRRYLGKYFEPLIPRPRFKV
jgi:hypothetical protein